MLFRLPSNLKTTTATVSVNGKSSPSDLRPDLLATPTNNCVKSSSWNKHQQNSLQQQQANASNAVTARLMDMGKKLLDASREGQVDYVRQLVVHSGAPFTSDWLGTTALHLAAQHGHPEIAEILLKAGVNRDARTKLERTALHLAAQGGSVKVVDLLLIHGSDVNARDMLKMTPLHWAVERGHASVAEKLLINGADVSLKSKFQLTPIDIAQDSECFEMIELFKVSKIILQDTYVDAV